MLHLSNNINSCIPLKYDFLPILNGFLALLPARNSLIINNQIFYHFETNLFSKFGKTIFNAQLITN